MNPVAFIDDNDQFSVLVLTFLSSLLICLIAFRANLTRS